MTMMMMMMRRLSTGDLPATTNNNNHCAQQLKHKSDDVDANKHWTGCFGCLSKRNTQKCDSYDETLNNAKHRDRTTEGVQPLESGNEFLNSLTKKFQSNLINNLNSVDQIESFDKETSILNNSLENQQLPGTAQPPTSTTESYASEKSNLHAVRSKLPAIKTSISETAARSDFVERRLSFQLDNSSRPENNVERPTTTTTDAEAATAHCGQENIYDSVRHFSRTTDDSSSKKKDDLDSIDLHHKTGRDLVMRMDSENFDAIRFEGYRTAQKLNFIRQKLKLHHVDIQQVMNAFGEYNARTSLNIGDLYDVSAKLYSGGGNSLPASESQSKTTPMLVGWLLHVYDLKRIGRVEAFSAKVALSSVCVGPLFDKLKYIFKNLHNKDGTLTREGLQTYLQSVLLLPASLSPQHHHSSNLALATDCGLEQFLQEMVRGEVPSCLGWLQNLHNLIRAEQAIHTVECASCHVANFSGFLYECLECQNYFMCQACFWRGFTSEGHTVQHKVKEFVTSPQLKAEEAFQAGTLGLPYSSTFHHQKVKSNLPAPPLSSINGFFQPWSSANNVPGSSRPSSKGSMISVEESMAGRRRRVTSLTSEDDEHKLILRYVHKLKCSPLRIEPPDPVMERQNLVFELEAKNREIQKEIHRLKCHQMQQRDRRISECEQLSDDQLGTSLLKEIRLLRQHQGELEARMKGLQGSRRGLMQQLEGLMSRLKTQSPSVCSPRSYCDSPAFTYPSNPHYVDSLQNHHSLPLHQPCHPLQHPIQPLPSHAIPPQQQPFVQQSLLHQPPVQQSYPPQQLLPQPAMMPPPSYASPPARFPLQPFQSQKGQLFPQSSPKSPGLNPVNYSVGSEFHQAFAFPSPSNVQGFQNVGLRQDLLMATDKVTDAVSSLVLELNTGESSDSDHSMALKSPGRKGCQAHPGEFDSSHAQISSAANQRRTQDSQRLTELRRGGSLRGGDITRPLEKCPQEIQMKGRQGVASESELSNAECDRGPHARPPGSEEEAGGKWDGPKRRWSNR